MKNTTTTKKPADKTAEKTSKKSLPKKPQAITVYNSQPERKGKKKI